MERETEASVSHPDKGTSNGIDPSMRAFLADQLRTIEDHLRHGIMPFWSSRAVDSQYGGFVTNFDASGNELACPEKYVNTQCRLIWWFATLSRRIPGQSHALAMASQGVDFLIRFFWDEQHGGFVWKVRRDGSELDNAKIVYGESFCIYALSEYFLASRDSKALEYAARTFELLQKYCADTRYGGYLETLKRDWSPERPGFGGGDRKGLDAHMHLMESFTTLYGATGDPLHRRKLLEIIDLICDRMIDTSAGCGLNQFDLSFRSLPAIPISRTWNGERLGEQPPNPVDTTSYGHNIELEYLMHMALCAAHRDISPYLPVFRRLLDHTVQHGVDWECGGIFRDGLRATGVAAILEKEFWQHSEALVGFLDGYELFGDPLYLNAFASVWRFVQEFLVNSHVGEWRTLVSRSGQPIDANIGNPWKVAYHTGRAMLECRERLTRLLWS